MPRQPREKPGLQAERTRLSWERSALGFLAGGAVLLLRQGELPALGRTLLAVAAVLLVLLVLGLGRRRGRRMSALRAGAGNDIVPDARTEVLLIGWATAGFATAIAVLLAL